MLGHDDSEQLEKAISLQRCPFTHNRIHYEGLHRKALAEEKKHFGIIIGSRRNVYELARRIAVFPGLSVFSVSSVDQWFS